MTDIIKIDIVSDVVCPWCIIGYKRLSKAITEMAVTNKIEVEWHPFQLNPDMVAEGEEMNAHMARKCGMTREACRQSLAQMTSLGVDVGFTFDFFYWLQDGQYL